MKQYQEVLQDILDNGREKESGRENMPNTIGLSHATILMKDVSKNFPLLTTKKMYWKGIVCELLWFLRGETNIKYLVDNNVNIWNGDAYRWYLKYAKEAGVEPMGMESFIAEIKANDNELPRPFAWWQSGSAVVQNYKLGDLGKVYGHQWRNQNGVDQVQDVFDDLKNNPYGRYKIIDGWNKRDFPEMALPPCHLLYQFIVRPMTLKEREDIYYGNGGLQIKDSANALDEGYDPDEWRHMVLDGQKVPKYYLDLNMYQRSCDTFLGVPFNIASMSLLLILVAKANNMVAGESFWIGGDTHLYVSHMDAVKEQLSRTPTKLPTVEITRRIETLADVCNLTTNDIILKDYESQDSIKAELFTGLKKK